MDHWEIIRQQAQKFLDSGKIYTSFIKKRRYQVIEVSEKSISIYRLDGGNIAIFGKIAVDKAIENLKSKTRLRKTELKKSVVRETTLIYLHPSIAWEDSTKEIIWQENYEKPIVDFISVIENASDDEFFKIQISVNQRKFQNKFRRNLFKLYSGKCAISGEDTEYVLEAAHINSHSKNGVNSNDNGILLRSDLHILFDRDLIFIHPKYQTIHLDKTLKISSYAQYENKKIAERIDGSKLNEQYLIERWDLRST